MGFLQDGVWMQDKAGWARADGQFKRADSPLRNWVTPDGNAGPSGTGGFAAAPGRYHLYVSLACPWAHRTLIMRRLKGLEPMIGLSVVHWLMREDGWTFADGPGVIPDPIHHARFLRDIYVASDPKHNGRVTVPVLWDKELRQIVSNESTDIIRMFGSAFDRVGAAPGDFYPEPLRAEIDAVNARIYDTLNNGVYKAGFATSQEAYEGAIGPLFDTLEWLEQRLVQQPHLCGPDLTEADIRLFTTLVRFDAVYVGHFKCNKKRLADYPKLLAYMTRLARHPAFAPTIDLFHIKHHYYQSHLTINPTAVVPLGPDRIFADDPV